MLGYYEFLIENTNVPTKLVVIAFVIFFIMQCIGETLEFSGKFIVPEFMKVRKYISRKKKEKEEKIRSAEEQKKATEIAIEAAEKATIAAERAEAMLRSLDKHYDNDNITKRDNWMKSVDHNGEVLMELVEKVNEVVRTVKKSNVEDLRNIILNFAQKVSDANCHVTNEEFRRVDGVHEEYLALIEELGIENGQVTIAYRIICEEYERRLREHAFIENMRGYENV